MTLISWCYMLLTWTAIIGLNVFCFYKIFSRRNGNGGERPTEKE